MNIKKIIKKSIYYLSSFERFERFFIGRKLYRLFNFIYALMRVKENKVVLISHGGAGFGDNPKYIALELLKKGGYDIVWLIDSRKKVDISYFPSKIRIVKLYTFKAIKELTTAGVWINNNPDSFYPHKKKSQLYIMTWHGNFYYKKVALAMADLHCKNFEKVKRQQEKVSNTANYFISDCAEKNSCYREAFLYKGAILEIGSPRCDILYNKEVRGKFRDKFSFTEEEKVILYAPTFRDDHNLSVYDLDYSGVKNAFEKLYNAKIKLLVRLHPGMNEMYSFLRVPPFVKNVSAYPDMQELLCSIDVLITDFSSSPFDFILTGRPIFLYVKDTADYAKKERGLNYLPNQLPFEYAYSNEELCKRIENFNYLEYKKRIDAFLQEHKFFGNGNATEEVVKVIEGGKE